MDGDEESEAEHESSPRAVPALELTFSMRLSQRSSSEHTPSSQVAAGHAKLCSPSCTCLSPEAMPVLVCTNCLCCCLCFMYIPMLTI